MKRYGANAVVKRTCHEVTRFRVERVEQEAGRTFFPHDLWEHVTVGKCLMATQAHDIWLILGSEWPNIVRKQDPKFLTFSPMRTNFMKKVNQAVLISENEGCPRSDLANGDPWM